MFVVTVGLAFGRLVLDTEVTAARLLAVQRVARHQFAQFEEIGQTQCLFQFDVEVVGPAHDLHVLPELLAQRLNLDDRLFERLLGAGHTDVLPHDVAQLLVDVVHRLLAVDRQQLLDFGAHALLGLVEGGRVGLHLRGLDLVRQVVADGVGQHEVTVGKTLHQRRSTQTVGSVIREVGLADGVEAGNGGHQVVVDPDAAHGVVYGGEDLHRLLVGAHVGDLLVHVEEVAVTLLDDLLAQTLDGGLEVEEDGQTGLVHAEACVAALLGGTRRHVARHEVAEGRIAALQIVVAILLGDVRRLLGAAADRLHVLDLLRYPDAAVVTQRFGHQRQFRLLRAVYGDAGGVDLREAGVGEAGALAVALEGGRTVRRHGVGREEEDVAVTSRRQYDGVCSETFQFACHEVAGDDAARLAVLDDDVEHLVARITLHRTCRDLLVQCGVGTQKELLTRLAAGIEGTRYLRAAERTVGQQAAVLACEGHPWATHWSMMRFETSARR